MEGFRVTNTKTGRVVQCSPPSDENGWTAIVTVNDVECMRFLFNEEANSFTDESGKLLTVKELNDIIMRLVVGERWSSKEEADF